MFSSGKSLLATTPGLELGGDNGTPLGGAIMANPGKEGLRVASPPGTPIDGFKKGDVEEGLSGLIGLILFAADEDCSN